MLLTLVLASALLMPRVDYVKREIVKAGVPNQTAEKLFSDNRLATYSYLGPERHRNWSEAIAELLEPESIERGRQFLQQHKDLAKKTYEKFGVDGASLVAVMRVETNLGQKLGTYSVFNVFYTLLLKAPEKKWRWYARNLASLIFYCNATGQDCFSIIGSYAGAFGLPQFLPYSLATFGVDGNADGVVDLFDPADAFPSTAHFLQRHGWNKNPRRALVRYVGGDNGYQRAVLLYAQKLRGDKPVPATQSNKKQTARQTQVSGSPFYHKFMLTKITKG